MRAVDMLIPSLLSLLALTPTGLAAKTCYWPSGDVAEGYFPCRQTGESQCCMAGDICLSNGLCQDPNDSSNNWYWREACTDQYWIASRCAANCLKVEPTGYSLVLQCGPTSFCCYNSTMGGLTGQNDDVCCNNTAAQFIAATPSIIGIVSSAVPTSTRTSTSSKSSTTSKTSSSLSSSITTSSTSLSTTSTSPSTASPTSSTSSQSNDDDDNLSALQKRGIIAGATIGASIFLLAAVFLIYYYHRRRRAERAAAAAEEETHKVSPDSDPSMVPRHRPSYLQTRENWQNWEIIRPDQQHHQQQQQQQPWSPDDVVVMWDPPAGENTDEAQRRSHLSQFDFSPDGSGAEQQTAAVEASVPAPIQRQTKRLSVRSTRNLTQRQKPTTLPLLNTRSLSSSTSSKGITTTNNNNNNNLPTNFSPTRPLTSHPPSLRPSTGRSSPSLSTQRQISRNSPTYLLDQRLSIVSPMSPSSLSPYILSGSSPSLSYYFGSAHHNQHHRHQKYPKYPSPPPQPPQRQHQQQHHPPHENTTQKHGKSPNRKSIPSWIVTSPTNEIIEAYRPVNEYGVAELSAESERTKDAVASGSGIVAAVSQAAAKSTAPATAKQGENSSSGDFVGARAGWKMGRGRYA